MNPRPSNTPISAAIATLLSVLTLASAACSDAGASPLPNTVSPEPIRVTTSVAVTRAMPKTLDVTGALVADESADVAAERDGRVADVKVERGSWVEKGAILATLDAREARASLAEAKAQVDWAASEEQRYGELRAKGVVARAEKQRKEIEGDTARARLELAQKAFEDTVIRAPFSGLVTEKKISAGAFVRRGQAVAGLVKVDPLRAELAIPESAAASVAVGQPVRISVQTFPGKSFAGKIAYVGPSLRSDARTLVVEAVLPNKDRLLKPGLFATASIDTPASAPATLIPGASVVADAGVPRVFVLGRERVEERLVSLGDRHGDLVEVKCGVQAGEKVVLAPEKRLVDGLEVAR
jgi:membrane fusion protein (multidrug efflux system)